MGTWLGAMVFVCLMGRLKQGSAVRRFALELPLMNLVYLLIPLMWLNSLSTGEETARLWLMLLLGLLGSEVLASIYTHRFKDGGNLTPNKLSLFALSWFVVASLPALANFPIEVTSIGIIIAIFVQIPARISLPRKRDEKRFELPTLRILLPLYVIYLILVAVWPTTLPFHDWQLKTNFQELSFNGRIVFTFRFIELIAAFTLTLQKSRLARLSGVDTPGPRHQGRSCSRLPQGLDNAGDGVSSAFLEGKQYSKKSVFIGCHQRLDLMIVTTINAKPLSNPFNV